VKELGTGPKSAKKPYSSEKIHQILSNTGYQIFQIDEDSCRESMINEFDLDNI